MGTEGRDRVRVTVRLLFRSWVVPGYFGNVRGSLTDTLESIQPLTTTTTRKRPPPVSDHFVKHQVCSLTRELTVFSKILLSLTHL